MSARASRYRFGRELVVLDDQGKPEFERLRRRALLKKEARVELAAWAEPAALLACDILKLRGKDLRKLPLLKRKGVIQDALLGSQRVRPVQYIGEQGVRLYEAAAGLELEGIVAKRGRAIQGRTVK